VEDAEFLTDGREAVDQRSSGSTVTAELGEKDGDGDGERRMRKI